MCCIRVEHTNVPMVPMSDKEEPVIQPSAPPPYLC
jgi:hypothetical protein